MLELCVFRNLHDTLCNVKYRRYVRIKPMSLKSRLCCCLIISIVSCGLLIGEGDVWCVCVFVSLSVDVCGSVCVYVWDYVCVCVYVSRCVAYAFGMCVCVCT